MILYLLIIYKTWLAGKIMALNDGFSSHVWLEESHVIKVVPPPVMWMLVYKPY